MTKTKSYNCIDEREIKCFDNSPGTIQAGISFDSLEDGTPVLRFHYLELLMGKLVTQRTKSMYLNKKNTNELIKALKQLKFK